MSLGCFVLIDSLAFVCHEAYPQREKDVSAPDSPSLPVVIVVELDRDTEGAVLVIPGYPKMTADMQPRNTDPGTEQQEFGSDERKSGALQGNIGVDMDELQQDGAGPPAETQQQDASHGEKEK